MYYQQLASAYNEIESLSGQLEKINRFAAVLREADRSEVGLVVALTMAKIHPDWQGRPEIGVAEKMAIRVLAAASSVSENTVIDTVRKTGDIGLAAERLLSRGGQGTLIADSPTVKSVYATLESIAMQTGRGSMRDKENRLVGLLISSTPLETRYLMRTVTGDLRLGLGHMSIIDALAVAFTGDRGTREDIERASNIVSDLSEVAHVLATQGIDAVRKMQIQIGRPIGMMAAKRLSSAQEILEKTGGVALVEYKYDGERIQIHKDGDRVVLFSRRQEVITDQYPDVVQYVKNNVMANRCIVECECVGVDPQTGSLRPFQELMRRKRKTNIEEMSKEVPVALFFFDILYLEDREVTGQPILQRRALLEKIIKKDARVQLTRGEVIDSPERLHEMFLSAIRDGQEGIIAKAVHEGSTYQAGARSWLWIKLKASYKEGMADSYDLVVVGAMHGRGKRTGLYGAILASAYDIDTDTYPTVCKIGTGFTEDMLIEFKKRLEGRITPVRHPKVLSDVEADVWFEPAEVIEVVGDEITVSPTHHAGRGQISGGGLAIRFPRFTGRWREDKSPDQATTVEELIDAFVQQRRSKRSNDTKDT